MSYDDYEHSRSGQETVELYLFRFGSHPEAFLAVTDAETPITFDPSDGNGPVPFMPMPISRGNIEKKARLARETMTVEVPKNSLLGLRFMPYSPTSVVTLRIWSGHAPHPDAPAPWASGQQFAATWAGRVMEAVRTKTVTKFNCEPAGGSMKRPGLRRNYQRSCPHILYGTGCQADKEAATVTAAIDEVASNRLVFAPGWNTSGFEARKFVGGLVEWAGEFGLETRMILTLPNDNTVVMSGPTLGLQAEDEVSVILGCAHDLADCEEIHDNVLNYGGHPWIPKRNPINKNNHG